MTNSVLVLGTDTQATLSVIRSLGRAGIKVTLGMDEDSFCIHSRHVDTTLSFPSASFSLNDWRGALKDHLKVETYDLVIPTTDIHLVPIAMHRADFEPFGLFAIPDENGFQTTYYKNRTYDLADRLGVPRPKGTTITSLDELDEIPHNFTFPINPYQIQSLSLKSSSSL